MKLNSYSCVNEVRTVVIYSSAFGELVRTINPYNSKAFFPSVNIYGEPIEMYDDYYKISVPDLVECKNNPVHIKAKQKQGCIFVVWTADKYGSVYGTLYIPMSAIISHDILEEKKDVQGRGCTCVSYNDKLVLDPKKIQLHCKDSVHYFAKGSDPAPDSRCDLEDLHEELKKCREYLEKYPTINPENRRRYIALLEQKIADGFTYKVSQYRCIDMVADYWVLYNCVDHYEKTPEYVKLEKLTDQLKKINKHWSEDNTVRLLASFKLTKKRGAK